MNKFEKPPQKEIYPKEEVKKHLEELKKRMIEEEGSEELLARWDSLIEDVNKGERAKALNLLETLELRQEENIESWRKAILKIGLRGPGLSTELGPENKMTVFLKENFQKKFEGRKEEDVSIEERILMVEDRIREIYKQHDSIKSDTVENGEKEQTERKKDKDLLSEVDEVLFVYRKIRNSLYTKKYYPPENITKEPSS